MSEYTEVERPFLTQLVDLGWTVIDQGSGILQDAALSLRENFRQWLLPSVFDASLRAINTGEDGQQWLTDRQRVDAALKDWLAAHN